MYSTNTQSHLATQEEITKELHNIYEELCLEYAAYMESALNTVKVYSWPADRWSALRLDLTDNPKMKIEEFKVKFPEILLKFLQRANDTMYADNAFVNLEHMQHTSDLLQRSFFNFLDDRIERHKFLVEVTLKINDKVKQFFYRNRERLEVILQSRLKLKSDVERWKRKNTQVTPTTESRVDHKEKRKNIQNVNEVLDVDDSEDLKTKKRMTSSNQVSKMADTTDFSKCVCVVLLKAPYHPKQYTKCFNCKQNFHLSCMKIKECDTQGFMCPYCTIIEMDPFFPVTQIILQPVFFALNLPQATKNFQFSVKDLEKMHCLQMRCLRVDDNHGLDEPTWPDYGEILVNGTRVQEFKALAQNTSLKKRKDSVYTMKEKINLNGQNNFVTLRELKPTSSEHAQLRISTNQIYMATFVVTQVLNSERLLRAICSSPASWIPVGRCKQRVVDKQAELGKGLEGIEVEKLKVTVTCPFTMQRIETPARGVLCTHVQCFSLENLIKITYNAAHRKWRCPICKKKCFKLELDSYQKKILDQMREQKTHINEIIFKEDGEIDETHFQMQDNAISNSYDSDKVKESQEDKAIQIQQIVIDEDIDQPTRFTKKTNEISLSIERLSSRNNAQEIIMID